MQSCFKICLVIVGLIYVGCTESHKLPKKGLYRTLSDEKIIAIISPSELEFRTGGKNIVYDYNLEGETLRITITENGQKEAIYLKLVPNGIEFKDGTVLFNEAGYEAHAKFLRTKGKELFIGKWSESMGDIYSDITKEYLQDGTWKENGKTYGRWKIEGTKLKMYNGNDDEDENNVVIHTVYKIDNESYILDEGKYQSTGRRLE